jgi:hypothetical protein
MMDATCIQKTCVGEYLGGGIPTPLKNMKVSRDDVIPHIWKNKTCSKPPIRYESQICFVAETLIAWCSHRKLLGFSLLGCDSSIFCAQNCTDIGTSNETSHP